MFSSTGPQGSVRRELAQGKVFVQGVDKQGRPVALVVGKNHVPGDRDEARRMIVYTLDKLIALNDPAKNPSGKLVGIFDLDGFGYRNYEIYALRAVFDLLGNHYVERLATLYLYCAPALFVGIWNIVAPFVDPVTRQKVVFISRQEAATEFGKIFPAEVSKTWFLSCNFNPSVF